MRKSDLVLMAGIFVAVFLVLGYFIPVQTRETVGPGVSSQVTTPLLGILIFHSPFMLGIYIFIDLVLLVSGVYLSLRKKSTKAFKHGRSSP